MKLLTTVTTFDQAPLLNQLFFALWKQKRGYPMTKGIRLDELLELSSVIYPMDLKYDYPARRTTFNNLIEYNEAIIAFDGSEIIDTLWFEVNEKLKRRINKYFEVYGKV